MSVAYRLRESYRLFESNIYEAKENEKTMRAIRDITRHYDMQFLYTFL